VLTIYSPVQHTLTSSAAHRLTRRSVLTTACLPTTSRNWDQSSLLMTPDLSRSAPFTTMEGRLPDQAALLGVLNYLYPCYRLNIW
jgi:hypothetical protein